MTSVSRTHAALFLLIAGGAALALVGAACSGTASSSGGFGGSSGGSTGESNPTSTGTGIGGSLFATGSGVGGGQMQAVVIKPMNPVLVYMGSPLTQQFDAYANGNKVAANWSIDNVQIGTIDNTGLFTASGQYGGTTKITAQVGNSTGSTDVTVKVAINENPGGVSPGDIMLLQAGGNADGGFKWLYPYDATVWPRGLSSPVLQFGGQPPSAVWVHMESATKGIMYDGFYGPSSPGRVTFADPTWKVILGSVGANEDLTVKVTKLSGGQATGPITETWKVAQGSLKGTLYYNSYNSQLGGNIGAILKLKPGGSAQLLAGGGGKCVVCHTVSASGNVMLAADSGYSTGGKYDLLNNASETGQRSDHAYNFPAVYPDGTIALTGSGQHIGGDWSTFETSFLVDTATGSQIPAPGFDGVVTRAAMPAWAPDGTRIAFNDEDMDDRHTLGVMDFDKKSNTFSNMQVVAHDPSNSLGWPSFLPDSKWVVHDVNNSTYNGGDYGTWFGNRANLAIVDVATKNETFLDALNGIKNGSVYLPFGADDAQRNYEPTVMPEAMGGYYWVVFTSRRQYGNTINTVETGAYGDTTRKKLWIAAIDLNPVPGQDSSHPAIYLPGQEDVAGNMRGFWVFDPCKQNGNDCDSGDECCNGFCRQINEDGGIEKVCVPPPMGCAMEFETCNTDADCCNSDMGYQCINHHCAAPPPPK